MEDVIHLPVNRANRRAVARRRLLAGIAGFLAILLLAAFLAQIAFAGASMGNHAAGVAQVGRLLNHRLPQPPEPSALLRAVSAFALLFFLGGALVSPLFRRPRRNA
jgi:hypothetical protein